MAGPRASTLQLKQMILDDFLKTGGGNLNPTLDELAIAWREEAGVDLADAMGFIDRRMGTVLELLGEDGWPVWVPYTGTFKALNFHEYDDPRDADWKMMMACIAGQGKGSTAIGYHFHIPNTEHCWMWEAWQDFYVKVENGVKDKSKQHLDQAIDHAGQPTAVLNGMTSRRLGAAKDEVKEAKALDTKAKKP